MTYRTTPWLALVLASVTMAQDRDKPWYRMDYGPVISTTAQGFSADNVAYKARAIDLGDGAWVIFDTEMLRVAAAWTGGHLSLRGTPFDGAHGPIPEPVGQRVVETWCAPGWRVDGDLPRTRPVAYGPLPREQAGFRGMYLHGDRVVLDYSVADSRVLDSFRRVAVDGAVGIVRTIEIDRVGRDGLTAVLGCDDRADTSGDRAELWHVRPEVGPVTIDRAARWDRLGIGAPSGADYADQASKHGVTARWVDGFGVRHPSGAPASALLDGAVAGNADQPPQCVFTDDERARIAIDLRHAIDVQRINTYSWHRSARAPQRYRLFGSRLDEPDFSAKRPGENGWTEIAQVDTRELGQGGQHGASVGRPQKAPGDEALGRFRHLLFDIQRAPAGTFFTEIDVFEVGQECPLNPREERTRLALATAPDGAEFDSTGRGDVILNLPPSASTQRASVVMASGTELTPAQADALVAAAGAAEDLEAMTRGGGPARWEQEIVTEGVLGSSDEPWVVDTITVPANNPWDAWLRFGAFDFTGPGAAVLSTWNGDLWRVSGIDADLDELRWRRIATGLHDPLGLLVVDDVIHVHCRDGIHKLHDLDGDGEVDHYECLNNDVLVTRNFHEFAFDLQRDRDGNFYFSKGAPVRPGGRGFDEITPHHGTILKLSPDGERLEVYATGLRAPNGIGLSPNGVVTSGDNEGTWLPACRLNWLPEPGLFTSCVDTSHREPRPTAYGDPLCWFPMEIDNSGGGQAWVPDDRFGPFAGELLHLSYGTCTLYLVMRQQRGDGRVQGGVAKFPLAFASSLMRGRFHDADGQLYVCGFKGWQTRAARETAFQRVRYVGGAARMPCRLEVSDGAVVLGFATPLDVELAVDPESYAIEIWDYKWSEAYGSAEYRPSDPSAEVKKGVANRDALAVTGVQLLDPRTVRLSVDGLRRCMQMKVSYDLETEEGAALLGAVHSTVNFVK